MSDQTQYPTPTQANREYYERANQFEREVMHIAFGPDAFRPKSPFDAIKTVGDAGDYLGMKPYYMRDVKEDDDYEKNPKEWNKAMYYFDALCVARALNRIANGGEEWEWEADGEERAFVCFNSENGIQCASYTYPDLAGCRFKTREAAEYFASQFPSLITALK